MYIKMTKLALYRNCFSYGHNYTSTKTLRASLSRRAPWNVVFFGSDDFSYESLMALHSSLLQGDLIKQLTVVTSGVSKKNRLKEFAIDRKLPIYFWPDVEFSADFDVGFVSSFGHLIPEHIISQFPLGILNVHASLLPRWRGAAPIVHAILNNDTMTGITIMRIKPHRFDVGDILKQMSCPIMPHDTTPELTRRLAKLGAQTLMDCIAELPECLERAIPQPSTGIMYAPKVSREMSKVQWKLMDSKRIYSLHRALVGLYSLTTEWHGINVKLKDPLPPPTSLDYTNSVTKLDCQSSIVHAPGSIKFDKERNLLNVFCADEMWISFKCVIVPGKKLMTAAEFFNGYLSKRPVRERIFS